MVDEQGKTQTGGRRFRLPRLFSDNSAESGEAAPEVEEAAGVEESAPQTAETPDMPEVSTDTSVLLGELYQMRGGMETIYRLITEINQRETAQEKVFNTLHSELRDYKNDFIYEHLKPVVRPLLFLFDSLEQFNSEIALHERPAQEERRAGMSPRLVRENILYFREQLIEALRICEVTMMENLEGPFNPKLHKAIEVVPVPAEQDNTIVRVVRSGWYLNGQLLRPAEIVLGRAKKS